MVMLSATLVAITLVLLLSNIVTIVALKFYMSRSAQQEREQKRILDLLLWWKGRLTQSPSIRPEEVDAKWLQLAEKPVALLQAPTYGASAGTEACASGSTRTRKPKALRCCKNSHRM